MNNHIYVISHKVAENVSNTWKEGIEIASKWGSFAVKKLQQHPYHAIGFIATTNILFFATINQLINHLDHRLEKRIENQKESGKKRVYKCLLLDGVMTGGLVYAFNQGLSLLAIYPLSQLTITAIVATSILTRLLLRKIQAHAHNPTHQLQLLSELEPGNKAWLHYTIDGKEWKTVPFQQEENERWVVQIKADDRLEYKIFQANANASNPKNEAKWQATSDGKNVVVAVERLPSTEKDGRFIKLPDCNYPCWEK